MNRPLFLFAISALFALSAFAHQQPTTLVRLNIAPQSVTAELHLPLTEWELAFGQTLSQDPASALPHWRPQLEAYLQQHIHPSTNYQPWHVHITNLQVQSAEQVQSGAFQEALVTLELTPPQGASTRQFTLHYDAILHQVVTHKAIVSIGNDWAGGQTAANPAPLGVIQVNTETTRIAPIEVRLGPASQWAGARAMLLLGVDHIAEGTDHLLFLLVLLLPAPLLATARHWGQFGGYRYSLLRLFKTVTAFTLGHSLTLLIGALGWVQLPQQPVEIAIAISILVSAAHAIRPLFSNREHAIAASFGLVHGLAFASSLAELRLPPAELALSILSFNLGIELMQLFVIALTIPWLLLLSPTPTYKWTRLAGAVLASFAALAWLANRATGQPNPITTAIDNATAFAPVGILLLAAITGLSLWSKQPISLPEN